MSNLLTVAEALARIDQHTTPLAPRPSPLSETHGLILADNIASDIDSPPHDKAMMDGYAIRTADGAAAREVIEEVFAGGTPTRALRAGQATRIMTGAPVPLGADAVVPVEQTQCSGSAVRIAGDIPKPGKHIMLRGEAIGCGDVVLQSGAMIGAAQIALLAEVGCGTPHVVPRPTVAVLPTGDELVDLAARPAAGQIRNSNGPMLLAAVAQAGATPIEAGVARDTEADLREKLLACRDADVLLLSGGVSAGVKDLAPAVLAELGVERVFHKVAIKPGKPLWFGRWPGKSADGRPDRSETLVFGLPGNPVSSFVCFQVIVRPALAKLAGRRFAVADEVEAVLSEPFSHRGGRETFYPATLPPDGPIRDRPSVTPVVWRGSADVAGLARANALMHLPVEPREFVAGDMVRVMRLT